MMVLNPDCSIDMPWWCEISFRTGFQRYSTRKKSADATKKCFQHFLRPSKQPGTINTDNSLECVRACEDFCRTDFKSALADLQTNGTAERAVRWVKGGTASVLVQCGFSNGWRSEVMECSCYLNKIDNPLVDGMLHDKESHAPFDGPIWPSGATYLLHKPISQKDKKSSAPAQQKDVGCHFHRVCPHTGDEQESCSSQIGKDFRRTLRQKFMSKDSNPENHNFSPNNLFLSEFSSLTIRRWRSLGDSFFSMLWQRSYTSPLNFLRALRRTITHCSRTHRRSSRTLCKLAHSAHTVLVVLNSQHLYRL